MASKLFRPALVAAVFAIASTAGQADPLFVSFENFTYSGTVTRYGSLADAQSQTNAAYTSTIQTANNGPRSTRANARDGQVYFANQATGYDPNDLAYASTAWYFTTTPASGDGWGNPNNQNDGFFQYYTDAVPSVTGGWSAGNTQFHMNVSGGDGDAYNYARLWAPPKNGPASETGGLFHEFSLDATAMFASAATLNGSTGWYETGAMPTAFSGTLDGIFENDNATDTSTNGFYRFAFTLNGPGSWAADNGAVWGGANAYAPGSFWAAPEGAAVPEPSGLALVGLALASLALVRRRRSI